MEEKVINLILPGFSNISRNEILINIYKNYAFITLENSKIHSFYGNFPSCIWNGGRLCLGEKSLSKYMKKIRDFHNNNDISIALTMTGLLVDKTNLDDDYSNCIMKIFDNGKNEVLVSNNILEKYIREKYPRIKINKSITSREDPLKKLHEYNLSLIPSQKVNDEKYIENIPLELRKNVEVLCNDPCVTNCKYKYIHYSELSFLQMNGYHESDKEFYGNCRRKDFPDYTALFRQRSEDLFISPNYLFDYTQKYHINFFKINGREKYVYYGYDNIVLYCIKEKYREDVLCYMLERMLLEYEVDVMAQYKKFGEFREEFQIGVNYNASR